MTDRDYPTGDVQPSHGADGSAVLERPLHKNSRRLTRAIGALTLVVAAPVAVHQINDKQNSCVQYVSTLSVPFVFHSPSGKEIYASREDGKLELSQIPDPLDEITIRLYEETDPRVLAFGQPSVKEAVRLRPDRHRVTFSNEIMLDDEAVKLTVDSRTNQLKVDHCD